MRSPGGCCSLSIREGLSLVKLQAKRQFGEHMNRGNRASGAPLRRMMPQCRGRNVTRGHARDPASLTARLATVVTTWTHCVPEPDRHAPAPSRRSHWPARPRHPRPVPSWPLPNRDPIRRVLFRRILTWCCCRTDHTETQPPRYLSFFYGRY